MPVKMGEMFRYFINARPIGEVGIEANGKKITDEMLGMLNADERENLLNFISGAMGANVDVLAPGEHIPPIVYPA